MSVIAPAFIPQLLAKLLDALDMKLFSRLRFYNWSSWQSGAGQVTIAWPRLRSPFWRIVTLTTLLSPLMIALGVSRWGLDFPFPPCLFQWFLGVPAPRCGLTRSVLALVAGDWSRSLSYHLFGPVMVVLAVVFTLCTTVELITQRSLAHWYQRLWQSRTTVIFFGVYVVYYGLRLWVRYTTLPSLPWGLDNTLAWQQFVAGAVAL